MSMIQHKSPISGIDAWGTRFVATAGYDNQVILWDTLTKRGVARSFHDHLVNQCRFSPCGQFLVSAGSDYTARIWTVPQLEPFSVLHGHEDDVEMAAISPNGSRVATASRDHTIGVFSFNGTLEHRLVGHTADVISVEWANGGNELISSSDDGTVRRWCPFKGKLLETLDLEGIETDTIAIRNDGCIYAGNDSGEIVIILRGKVSKISAHQAGIKRIAYEPQSQWLLTASYDRAVKLWSIETEPKLLLETQAPTNVWLRSCSFLGKDRLIFGTFGTSYATFQIHRNEWDLSGVDDTHGWNAVRMVRGRVYTVGDAGLVSCGGETLSRPGSLCNFLGEFEKIVVTGGQAGTLFNALTGEVIFKHHSPLNCCSTFQRNGVPHLIVGTYTGEGLVFVRRRDGSVQLVAILQMHNNAIKGLSCNADLIFSVCATGAAAFHSIDSFALVRFVPDAHRKISNGTATLPDGRFLSVSRDLKLRIWTLSGCEEIDTPHNHSIKCVAVALVGRTLATGSYDGTVAVFDWMEHKWIRIVRPTTAGISSLCSTDEKDSYLASSYDGRIYSACAAFIPTSSTTTCD